MGLDFSIRNLRLYVMPAAVSAAGFVKGSAPTAYMPIRRSGGW